MAGLRHLAPAILAFSSLCQLASTQGPTWRNPDSSRPDLSQSYHNADAIVLSWQGLNESLSDLWLTSYDTTHDYALRIAANINITNTGTLPWTVTVNETEIDIDDRFTLRFIPTGTVYQALQVDQFASPGFILLQRGEIAPPSNGSATNTAGISSTEATGVRVTSSDSPSGASVSPTSTPAGDSSSGMGSGTKAGIAIAATVSVVVILALLLWVVRLRRRVNAASNHRSAGIIPPSGAQEMAPSEAQGGRPVAPKGKRISGLHEVLGDRRQPTELSTAKPEPKVYHELAG